MKRFDKWIEKYEAYDELADAEYGRILKETGISLPKPLTVLEIGRGSGAFTSRLARMGFDVVAIDISTKALHSASVSSRNATANFL